MIQVSCVSSAVREMDTQDLLELLQVCLRNNSALGVTGSMRRPAEPVRPGRRRDACDDLPAPEIDCIDGAAAAARDVRFAAVGADQRFVRWLPGLMGFNSHVLASACLCLAVSGVAAAAGAGVKEKPALYTYIAEWQLPRAKWAELEKDDDKASAEAFAQGSLVGYGEEKSVLHSQDGYDHASWLSAMSMGELLKVIEQAVPRNSGSKSVFLNATRHADEITVSHYYNWRSGNFTGAYTREYLYHMKNDAPDDALELIAGHFVPVLEKLLADKVLIEYEIDEMAMHSSAPGVVGIVCITSDAAGVDTLTRALHAAAKDNPLLRAAAQGILEEGAHRDNLAMTSAHFK